MRFISPKTDFCLKELFRNEVVCRYFLSDILKLPPEEIRAVRLLNPVLWKRRYYQKQGILDVLLEINDSTRINIEMQIKIVKHWDRRQVFYISKLLTEDLRAGKDYTDLKRCISVSILDFNLTKDKDYHRVYRLCDAEGRLFTDLLEVHVLELSKPLRGSSMDEWIEFFNAESEAEMDMIKEKTTNPGILAAISEVREMSLFGSIRALHEQRLKYKRDIRAREEYVWEEGHASGLEEGHASGLEEGHASGLEEGHAVGLTEGRTMGEDRMSRLVQLMYEKGEGELAAKLSDRKFREEMYEKYGIV